MESKNPETKQTAWTRTNTIELIRGLRNELIKDFLDERYLIEYLAGRYNKKELSNARMEFVRKELKELLIAPVDIEHYSRLIQEIEKDNTTSISNKNESLFYKEIERILTKYIF
jgi:hypothetical protein